MDEFGRFIARSCAGTGVPHDVANAGRAGVQIQPPGPLVKQYSKLSHTYVFAITDLIFGRRYLKFSPLKIGDKRSKMRCEFRFASIHSQDSPIRTCWVTRARVLSATRSAPAAK
jgi:hypothetical protein